MLTAGLEVKEVPAALLKQELSGSGTVDRIANGQLPNDEAARRCVCTQREMTSWYEVSKIRLCQMMHI